MKKIFLIIMMLVIQSTVLAADWRKSSNIQIKVENLVKLVPSASNIMLQMGERYSSMYWAAMQEKWEFAEYEMRKMEALIRSLMIVQPKYATTSKQFLKSGFTLLLQAFQSKKWSEFKNAFLQMRKACLECHENNQLAFITLSEKPAKGISPVLH